MKGCLFGWWVQAPTWLQVTASLLLLVIGGVLILAEDMHGGGTLVAVGVALLVFSGKSEAYKKGYHDF